MVAYHSLTVVVFVDVTMVTDSILLWVPVHPSVKRAIPHALRYRTTINSPVGAVILSPSAGKTRGFDYVLRKKLESYMSATGSMVTLN